MPITYNTVAKSTREMASNRRKKLLTVGLIAINLVIFISILLTRSASHQISEFGLLVLLFALRLNPDLFDGYSRRKVKTIRRADSGAGAEEDIGNLLAKLGPISSCCTITKAHMAISTISSSAKKVELSFIDKADLENYWKACQSNLWVLSERVATHQATLRNPEILAFQNQLLSLILVDLVSNETSK